MLRVFSNSLLLFSVLIYYFFIRSKSIQIHKANNIWEKAHDPLYRFITSLVDCESCLCLATLFLFGKGLNYAMNYLFQKYSAVTEEEKHYTLSFVSFVKHSIPSWILSNLQRDWSFSPMSGFCNWKRRRIIVSLLHKSVPHFVIL